MMLNAGNPIARGLKGLWPLWLPPDAMPNLAGKNLAIAWNSSPEIVTKPSGRAFEPNTTFDYLTIASDDLTNPPGDMTIVGFVNRVLSDSGDGTQYMLAQCANADWFMNVLANGNLEIGAWGASNNSVDVGAFTGDHLLAGVWIGTTGYVYKDVFQGSFGVPTRASATNDIVYVGNEGADPLNDRQWGKNFEGGMYWFGIWHRALSSAEILSLTARPWQLFSRGVDLIHADVPGPEVNAMIETPTRRY